MGKKTYPIYKLVSIIGVRIFGSQLRQYGFPFTNTAGNISERNNEGILDFMFLALERFPEIHPVSHMINGHVFNRFVEEAYFYTLHTGNNDPEIEFLPLTDDGTVEYHDYIDSVGFVDLEKGSFSKENAFAIQCLKNRIQKKT